MSYKCNVEVFQTSDMSSTRVYRSHEAEKNYIVDTITAGIVLYNPTAFTGLQMKIYTDNNGAPGALLATSTNSWSRAQLLDTSDNYGVKWPYFNFTNVVLRAGLDYHYVINGATGYTESSSQWIGWRIAYPDGIYDTIPFHEQLRWRFDMAFVGRRL